jgi:hypothetical protein
MPFRLPPLRWNFDKTFIGRMRYRCDELRARFLMRSRFDRCNFIAWNLYSPRDNDAIMRSEFILRCHPQACNSMSGVRQRLATWLVILFKLFPLPSFASLVESERMLAHSRAFLDYKFESRVLQNLGPIGTGQGCTDIRESFKYLWSDLLVCIGARKPFVEIFRFEVRYLPNGGHLVRALSKS